MHDIIHCQFFDSRQVAALTYSSRQIRFRTQKNQFRVTMHPRATRFEHTGCDTASRSIREDRESRWHKRKSSTCPYRWFACTGQITRIKSLHRSCRFEKVDPAHPERYDQLYEPWLSFTPRVVSHSEPSKSLRRHNGSEV